MTPTQPDRNIRPSKDLDADFWKRVDRARAAIIRGGSWSRETESIFENGDADCIACALIRKAENAPKFKATLIAFAGSGWGTIWLPSAERLVHIPTEDLPRAAEQMSARFNYTFRTDMMNSMSDEVHTLRERVKELEQQIAGTK